MIFVNSYTSFPVVGGATDPNFANVSLLLHADNNPTDTSPVGATMINSTTYNTTIRIFGAASFSFTNASTRLTTPSSVNYTFGSGNFTIEMWIHPFNVSGNARFFGNGLGSFLNGDYVIYFDGNKIRVGSNSGNVGFSHPTTININTWYHIAVARSGSTFYIFVNGVMASTTISGSLDSTTNNTFTIGGDGGITNNPTYNGLMDDIRITKGVARYTADFSGNLPTAAFPDA